MSNEIERDTLYFKNRAKKNPRHKTTRCFAPNPFSAWPKLPLHVDIKNHEVWTDMKKKRQHSNTTENLWIVKSNGVPKKTRYRFEAIRAA